MTQKIMMVVEQPRPVVMQTTEFVRGGGSSDYDALINKPAINGVTLDGDKTASELALATPSDVAAKYTKPSGGIPKTDLAYAVQTSLGKADAAYQKPSGGIPKSDLASAVQTSLGKADTAYQKPSSGIPASDLAQGVIPDLSNYQSKSIIDAGGYYTTDTVEGALQEIGAELAGINTLIGSGVIK